jgi:hypothetical protein
LTNIKHDRANAKLFYLKANGRKRKKSTFRSFGPRKAWSSRMRTKSKKLVVTSENFLGPSKDLSLNCEELNYPNFNLVDLDVDITGEEVKRVILDMPKENAPRPDGFIGAFYSTCWATVQGDVVQAIRQLA